MSELDVVLSMVRHKLPYGIEIRTGIRPMGLGHVSPTRFQLWAAMMQVQPQTLWERVWDKRSFTTVAEEFRYRHTLTDEKDIDAQMAALVHDVYDKWMANRTEEDLYREAQIKYTRRVEYPYRFRGR